MIDPQRVSGHLGNKGFQQLLPSDTCICHSQQNAAFALTRPRSYGFVGLELTELSHAHLMSLVFFGPKKM